MAFTSVLLAASQIGVAEETGNEAVKLALDGDKKGVGRAAPKAARWGEPALQQLGASVKQDSLCYWKNQQTKLFTERYQANYGRKYVQPCSSRTTALHIAVAAAGIAPGDKIITSGTADIGLRISTFFRPSAFGIRISSPRLACWIIALCTVMSAWAGTAAPAKIIFDTDVGNDVDDVLALSVLHAFQTRGECELLAVTITKPDELAGPFVEAMNTFYGRPGIPIGFTHAGLKNEPSKFLPLAEAKDDGKLRYPHRLRRSSDAP